MTDNDIVKAFKLCITCTDDKCRRCPARDVTACTVGVETGILDIIERRDAEIEALIAGQETLQKYIATARAKAIKEFAEKLKVCCGNNTDAPIIWVKGTIDNLVKEMTEETT